MTTTTDTPRTDARCYHYDSKWKTMTISPFGEHIEASFSKELERELLTARNDAFSLANALSKAEAEVKLLDAERRQWLENREKSTFQNWIERAEKAEAEVERLRRILKTYRIPS